MVPSEVSILTNFLLSPSPLPTLISLEKFTELFPRRLRSHPQIRVLYRELQHIRSQDLDLVRENIDKEIRRGERQREELRNAKRATGVSGIDKNDKLEMDMDIQLFGQRDPTISPENMHTLASLLPEMENACSSMEREIEAVDAEAARIFAELTSTVGELSDLRYGKFNKPPGVATDAVDDTITGLKELENACSPSGRD
ncbi:centromere-localized protein 2 [[Emmonsia] crescens]|uniref:Centromere-localized protein 2 n=1 Tax=[Emmonsia] crescens TaxID=73230 RepID=A0A2B7ZUF8_9EURO|nr:centromere-localized protein 2 [Emmonsia crescens]